MYVIFSGDQMNAALGNWNPHAAPYLTLVAQSRVNIQYIEVLVGSG